MRNLKREFCPMFRMSRMSRMGLLVLVALSLLVTLTLGSGVPMLGGPVTADVNDPMIKSMMRKAVLNFNDGINDMYLYKLNDVVSAKTQVVSGIRYIMDLKLGKTSCRKSQHDVDDENCSFMSGPEQKTHLCHFVIWSQVWLNRLEFNEKSCREV